MPTPPATDRTGLRERKKLATRRALQRAALALASERGSDVTVEEICAEVDVAPRTYFNYSSSKDEALVGEPPTAPPDDVLAGFEQGGPDGLLLHDLCDALGEHLRQSLPSIEEMRQRRELFRQCPHLLPHFIQGFWEIEQRLVLALSRRLGTDVDDLQAQSTAAVATALMRLSVRRWAQSGGHEPVDVHLRRAFESLSTT